MLLIVQSGQVSIMHVGTNSIHVNSPKVFHEHIDYKGIMSFYDKLD